MYGNSNSGFGNNRKGLGNRKPEDKVASVALQQAIDWNTKLMNSEFKGRGDKEYLVRHRVSQNSGVPERYLYRLQYQAKGMKDIAGEYYRRLKIYYEQVCENNEEAADRLKAERLGLRGNHEKADEKPAPEALGVGASQVGKEG